MTLELQALTVSMEQSGADNFLGFIEVEPAKAERMVRLYIGLGMEVTPRVLGFYGFYEMQVRAEIWGDELIKEIAKFDGIELTDEELAALERVGDDDDG